MVREDFSYESARLRALTDLTKAAIAPAVVFACLLKATGVQLGYYTVPGYGSCIFLWSYLRGLYHSFLFRKDAKRLAKDKGGPMGSVPV